MTERPIVFSGPMVRAILDGRKTVTRRVVKQVPHWDHCGRDIMEWGLSNCYTTPDGRHWLDIQTEVDDNSHDAIACPYGVAGDRLWVRETFQALSHGDYLPTKQPTSEIRYAATDRLANLDSDTRGYPWKPSIFMPRWASRITLEITAVRVERLQDIKEADAIAEGCDRTGWDEPTAYSQYAMLWDSINADRKDNSGERLPYAWNDNPWVWVVSFKRVEGGKQ